MEVSGPHIGDPADLSFTYAGHNTGSLATQDHWSHIHCRGSTSTGGYLTMLSSAKGLPAEPASSTDGQSYQDDGHPSSLGPPMAYSSSVSQRRPCIESECQTKLHQATTHCRHQTSHVDHPTIHCFSQEFYRASQQSQYSHCGTTTGPTTTTPSGKPPP